jgi:hypothetical protein
MPLGLAAKAAGVSSETFAQWRRKHPRFAELVQQAIAKGADEHLRRIEKAAEAGDWRASAWYLERILPQHFARNRVEVTGAGGAPLVGVVLHLPAKNGQPETKAIDITNDTLSLPEGTNQENEQED